MRLRVKTASLNTVKNYFALLFGAVYCILMAVFFVLSTPVYIFRPLVIFLAKHCHPEFGKILNAQSSIFAVDYMAETPPRSNVNFAMIFEGHLSLDEIKERVQRNLIDDARNLSFSNFQRYPVNWLGFTFWGAIPDKFLIDKHVHKYSGMETEVTEKQLIELTEVMLNQRFPKHQSPWELVLIENYKYPISKAEALQKEGQTYSVLILKWHHCLCDGPGIAKVIVEGIFEQRWMGSPTIRVPKMGTCEKFLQILKIPYELAYCFSHVFRTDPFKVPDNKKSGYQLCAKTKLISIQLIKDIKNAFGVCYASVLLSSISAAVFKTLKNTKKSANANKSMLCLTVLPALGIKKRKILNNHLTGALFDLPTIHFESPVERLRYVNRLMEQSKGSWIPLLGQYLTMLVGSHTYLLTGFLAKNRMISLGLTNIVGIPDGFRVDKTRKCIHVQTTAGGHFGETGVVVTATSHCYWNEVFVCAESSLFTKKQAGQFTSYIEEEIENLRVLAFDAIC